MRCFLLLFSLKFSFSFSQHADSIRSELWKVNQKINEIPCESGQLLTHRGMNLFLAERVSYYLADHENLSFVKNNITLNTATGIFSMSHSLFEPSGADEAVKSYNVIGLKANVFNAFQAVASKANFNNELGFTYKHFWVAKPKIILNNCSEKQILEAKRAIILKKLSQEIKDKGIEFENTLVELSDLNKTQIKELSDDFYKNLKEEYSRKFAEQQHRALFDSLLFKTIRTHWTNFNLYLPVMFQRFTIAENLITDFKNKKSYPAEISLSHTRFLETQKALKIYLNFRAGILVNNAINSRMLSWTSFESYKSSGGQKTDYLMSNQLDRAIIGSFKNFITPNIKAQLIFYPPENHFGLSATLEQNFGKYKALNGTLGIPVVLIDKQSEALSNFEIQIHYFDLTNSIHSNRNLKDNISIGLTWGQAIGRRVY
jgi:hypothetical protein